MNQSLQEAVLLQLQKIVADDSQHPDPIIQSISLFFWQNVQRWVRQISSTPEPFTIALTGASGSGKSFIREVLEENLSRVSFVSSFTQDNYYRDFEADFPDLPLALFYDLINFDDPAHILFERLATDLRRLKRASYGERIPIQKLCYGTPYCKPTLIPEGLEVVVAPFIVTEGIHAFYERALLPHYDFKIFVDIDEKTRRARWLERNKQENRGTTDNMWNTTVECLEQYILPARQVADVVINNNVAQDRVAHMIENIITVLTDTAERITNAA